MQVLSLLLVFLGFAMGIGMDLLQPDEMRKPKMNKYLGYLGYWILLIGLVLVFIDHGVMFGILTLFVVLIAGAILKPRA